MLGDLIRPVDDLIIIVVAIAKLSLFAVQVTVKSPIKEGGSVES
jgi:hypothetical protein